MKANYFKFGVFLIIAVALLVTAVVVLGAGVFRPQGDYFETYFDTSVSGLSPGAPVELQGVKIGRVENIGFASEIYDIPPEFAAKLGEERLVRVVFSVDPRFKKEMTAAERQKRRRAEIGSGLRVRLESNLLTGKGLLEGTYVDPNRFPVPGPLWETEFPFVPSAPGRFTTLTDSLDRILTKVEGLDLQGLFDHVDELILATNRAVVDANVTALGENARGLLVEARGKIRAIDAEKIGKQVEGLLADADGTLADLRVTNKHLQGLLARPDQDGQLANIAMMIDELNTAVRRIDLLITTQAPRLETTLANFQKISSDIRELSENLKRNPSSLLFSSPPRKSELQK